MQDKVPFWIGNKCFKIVLFAITPAAMVYQEADQVFKNVSKRNF
jgi:hypothetical protein